MGDGLAACSGGGDGVRRLWQWWRGSWSFLVVVACWWRWREIKRENVRGESERDGLKKSTVSLKLP